jgi:very-short-patch-repair endonuclease
MPRRDVPALVRLAGGATTVGALRRLGASRFAIDQAVAERLILRIGHGAVSVPDAPPAAVLAARTRAVPTCVTALEAAGIRLVTPPARPHLLTTHRRTERGAVWHRDRIRLPPDDLVAATLRAAACLPEREALAAVDNALFRQVFDRTSLLGHCNRASSPQVRWVLQHCDAAAESVLESLLRHLVLHAGITDVELQHRIIGVGRVDLLIDGWLILEADGHTDHSDRESLRRDNFRSSTAATVGYVTLRFGYDEIVDSPAAVLEVIQAARHREKDGHFRTRVLG